jgi:putative RecB family exonuclease
MANHVHATLRDFLSLQPVERRTATAIEKLLQRNWRRYHVGFRDEDDEARWAAKALAQVRAFVADHEVSIDPAMMETSMEVEVTPGLVLRGRIDRVDREQDESLHIIDYKTGNMPLEIDWSQLELYALMVSRHLPQPVSKISYLYLGPSIMQSTQISAEEMHRIHWAALNMARKIHREREFHPAPGLWCSNCYFIPICPSRMEAQPLAEASGQLELWDDPTDNGGDRH